MLLLGVAYREYRRGARGMAMICAGVTLTAVFGYVYHPPLLIAGIVLMLVGMLAHLGAEGQARRRMTPEAVAMYALRGDAFAELEATGPHAVTHDAAGAPSPDRRRRAPVHGRGPDPGLAGPAGRDRRWRSARAARSSPCRRSGLGCWRSGLLLFGASLRRFATEGEGTLAPWDPPRRLVVRGPYRYVRNPMISGVVMVLFGEAALLLSPAHLDWALIFLGINALYIPLLEEPLLALRFGEAYREYCRHVPRLVPRWRPWEPERGTRSPPA